MPQKRWILLLFLGGFLLSLFISFLVVRFDKISRLNNIIQSISTVRGYQGLVLDSKGLASLLIAVSEKPSDLFISKIELTRTHGQPLLQQFQIDSSRFVNSTLTNLKFTAEFEDYNLPRRRTDTYSWSYQPNYRHRKQPAS
jgi:hypothetical protein